MASGNQRQMESLYSRVSMIASRCIITGYQSGPKLPTVQVKHLSGESGARSNIELFQQYGLFSAPKPDSEGLALSLGGDRAHVVVIATGDRRFKITLDAGEVALADDRGNKVHLQQSNKITVEAAGGTKLDLDGAADTVNAEAAGGAKLAIDGTADTIDVETAAGQKLAMAASGSSATLEQGTGPKLTLGPSNARLENGTAYIDMTLGVIEFSGTAYNFL